MKKRTRPSVLDYDDYRLFLKDYYAFEKSKDKKTSYQTFSIRAGLRHKNHLYRVIRGELHISKDLVKKYIKGLKLNQREANFFSLLVDAGTSVSIKYIPLKGTLNDLHEMIIGSMVLLEEFCPDSLWISRRTNGVISPEQVKRALKSMLKKKILRVKDGKWSKSFSLVERSPEKISPREGYKMMNEMEEHHHNFFRRAMNSSEKSFTFAMLALSEKSAKELIEELRLSIQRKTLEFNRKGDKPDKVYYLGVSFSPFS